MRRPEPTQEELRAAWERCRHPSWPPTFEQAMAHQLLSRLVRITALHPPRAYRKPAERREPRLAFTSGSRDFLSNTDRRFMAVPIDRKRAAAGERDDD